MALGNSPHKLEDEESYFVSMTDIMVGMLFIFIIMLMAFALNLREQEEKFADTTESLIQANETRRQMLEGIKEAMERHGIKVIIDTENGVLRLPEELLFPRGEFQLTKRGEEALTRLADVLAAILPCYSKAPPTVVAECPPSKGGRLEAVFVEGHTDDRPVTGRMASGIRSNWELSTARSIQTYNALVGSQPTLSLLDNDGHQRILGVSGYAENRPVRTDDSEEARSANRRIDLRFLMATPNKDYLARMQEDVHKAARKP